MGSIIATTNDGGHVTSRWQYDAWGNLEVGADQPGYAFTGREWDPETGLYYYRARYYDSKIGRSISEDPIGLEGGINFYGYVDAAPTMDVDPFGLAVLVRRPGGWGRPPQRPGPNAPDWERRWYTLEAFLYALDGGGLPGPGAMATAGPRVATKGVVEALHNHYLFVRAFRSQFARAGIAIDKYLARIPASWHQRWVHSLGARGGQWNRAWREFFERNPNATAEEIWDQLYKMLETIGLCGPN